MSSYVLALDQGTTSSRAILFDRKGTLVSTASREFPQIFSRPGWVEHDPEAIWASQLEAARECLASSSVSIHDIAAIGITNQRETAVIWDRNTGLPIYNAIVWQSRQSEEICSRIRAEGLEDLFKARTGLVVDPYFSGTKIRWILDQVEGAQQRAENGELAFGTIDSWLIYRLTEGRVHATDYSNASRTLLFNIDTLSWDPELLEALNVPPSMLPEVRESSGSFGETVPTLLGQSLPIGGVAGDQQAALFGQACFEPGSIKNTYGTGCFALMNTGSTRPHSKNGLLSTIAWSVNGKVDYALEGSVFVAGAAVQWLRDQLGLIETAAESEEVAASIESTEGVFLVPAFTGLGAPYWDSEARGVLVGLTRGSSRAHLVRAALESIAYQSVDVVRCFEQDSGQTTHRLQVDGGATANNLLMQFQADILGVPVYRPTVVETTALGAAYLAGLSQGVWESQDDVRKNWQQDRLFEPQLAQEARQDLYSQWLAAVQRARSR